MKMFRLVILSITLIILLASIAISNANASKFSFSASITLVAKTASIDNSIQETQLALNTNSDDIIRSVNIGDDEIEFIYE
jgi:hypothetical protein